MTVFHFLFLFIWKFHFLQLALTTFFKYIGIAMPYFWSNNPGLRAARYAQIERVDMTSSPDQIFGARDLGSVDNGLLLRHTEVFIQVLRNNLRSLHGLTGVAIIESPFFNMDLIALTLWDLLPDATFDYFRGANYDWDWKVRDILIRIFRPVMFEPNVDEENDPDYNFYDEMKALGIPTYIQVLQVVYIEAAVRSGMDIDPNSRAVVRAYMAGFP
jgi:hypothetical protein